MIDVKSMREQAALVGGLNHGPSIPRGDEAQAPITNGELAVLLDVYEAACEVADRCASVEDAPDKEGYHDALAEMDGALRALRQRVAESRKPST